MGQNCLVPNCDALTRVHCTVRTFCGQQQLDFPASSSPNYIKAYALLTTQPKIQPLITESFLKKFERGLKGD